MTRHAVFRLFTSRRLDSGPARHPRSRLHGITRHMLGLFTGVPGARAFRRHLSEEGVKPGAGIAVLREALDLVLDRPPQLAHIAA